MVSDRRPSIPRDPPWLELQKITDTLMIIARTMQGIASQSVATASNGQIDLLIRKMDEFITIARQSPRTSASTFGLSLSAIEGSVSNKPAWNHGNHYIATAGQALAFPDLVVPDGIQLVVRALPGNTDDAYIAKSATEASRSTSTSRITLGPGEAVKLKINNAKLVFGDVAVSGEGFEYFSEQD